MRGQPRRHLPNQRPIPRFRGGFGQLDRGEEVPRGRVGNRLKLLLCQFVGIRPAELLLGLAQSVARAEVAGVILNGLLISGH